ASQHAVLDLVTLQDLVSRGLWNGAGHLQTFAFWGFMIALLIKSPAVPGHTWIADAYESAPIGAIVSGLVIKVGTYGMFRFVLPLFPDASREFAPIIVALGVVGIIYGGVVASKQDNPYRLMAYSTVSHVGYILVGIFSLNQLGLTGAAFQQVNHGIASGAVIVLLGFLSTRMDVSSLSAIGGLKRTMPVFSTVFLIAMLANLGLPFTSGFVGEILALIGAYQSASNGDFGLNVMMVAIAAGGAILSAVYMLTLYQKLFYGEAKSNGETPDLTSREAIVGQGFAVVLIVLGVVPMLMLGSLTHATENVQRAAMQGSKAPIKKSIGTAMVNPSAPGGSE
ncbi:MAG TPA: NADH-quinone oxidoreductase subunit M, partial [Fimbriimonas sp.]|nr:NADH-quinone oxidoreductase subunit M [Fimbriimonas sp.]